MNRRLLAALSAAMICNPIYSPSEDVSARRHLRIFGDLHLSEAARKSGPDTLSALRVVIWTTHGLSGYEFADRKVRTLTSSLRDENGGDIVFGASLTNIQAAIVFNARLKSRAAKRIMAEPVRYERDWKGAEWYLNTRMRTEPVVVEIERRSKECFDKLANALSSGIIAPSVPECEDAVVDPLTDEQMPTETYPERGGTSLPSPGSTSLTPDFRQAVGRALDAIDLMFDTVDGIVGDTMAIKRMHFASTAIRTAGDDRIDRAASGYLSMRLNEMALSLKAKQRDLHRMIRDRDAQMNADTAVRLTTGSLSASV